MRLARFVTPMAVLTAGATGLLVLPTPSGAATVAGKPSAPSCQSITQAQAIATGFTGARAPKVSDFNDKKLAANPPNLLGETIDFGAKALVVGCAAPIDLKALSVTANGAGKPVMTAAQYVQYLVRTSAGAMKSETIGGVPGYADYGNGREDGLGSTATAGSVRLDTFVAGNFVINFFSSPVSPALAPKVNAIARAITKNLALK
jgi:hypothetical protein